MKTRNKLLTLLILSSSAAAGIAMINKGIKISALSKHLLEDNSQSQCYKWRFGNIHYTKSGSGKPLLLVHDFDYPASSYEWHKIVSSLSEEYTVYTIDLLGCGRSEKPNLTYTNYLYVELLCDFIKSEIGHRTDIIATGESASFAIMACNHSPELFNRIMLINPGSLLSYAQVPNKNAKLYKFILDTPIIGTLLYHMASSRGVIEEIFKNKYFHNPYSVRSAYMDYYFESAHKGSYPKAMFSSLKCNYTKCNIANALKKIDNSIYLLGSQEIDGMEESLKEYQQYNSAIEYSLISKAKLLPQLECPDKVMNVIRIFFT